MRILVPVDFSKFSKVAAEYAVEMATHINAEVILLHVIYLSESPRALFDLNYESIIKVMTNDAKQECILLINSLKIKAENLNISYQILNGYPIHKEIESFSTKNEIDLIIIGTKGATGLTKVLIGSNATAVISESSISVITVPEYAKYTGINHIVYASDLQRVESEIQNLIPFTELFGSNIHILHVTSTDSENEADKPEVIKNIMDKFSFNEVSIHISLNDEIIDGIEDYINEVNADLLAMFTHELTFFEKIFGKSVTRQMAFHSRIPLLTIKK